jgi:hypothetical protein
MDVAHRADASLTEKVRECIDAELTVAEGAKYVGIYDDGYRAIAKLIVMSRAHHDQDIRMRCLAYLKDVDKSNGIGDRFQEIARFTLANQPEELKRKVVKRRRAKRGWRVLRDRELPRLKALTTRADISEDDQSLAKRLVASVVDSKLSSADHDRMTKLILAYGKPGVGRQLRSEEGWRKLKSQNHPDLEVQLRSLLEREDVSDADKGTVRRLLEGIVDGRLPSIDYIDAVRIVSDNKASKKERARRKVASSTFENAVAIACQASDNLTGLEVPVMPLKTRIKLVAQLSRSAANLLRLQGELIEESEYDD